jgi:hypothetical protein
MQEYKKARWQKLGKIGTIYRGREITGHGLECGFGVGNGLYWFSQRYPDTTYDIFDWASGLSFLVPLLEKIHGARLKHVWFKRPVEIEDVAGRQYDWINSIDFFEHLEEEEYWPTLKVLYRLLVPGGLLGVHVGKAKQLPHIRTRMPHTAAQEIVRVGFKQIDRKLFQKPLK